MSSESITDDDRDYDDITISDSEIEGSSADEEEDDYDNEPSNKFPFGCWKDIELNKENVDSYIGSVTQSLWDKTQEEIDNVYAMVKIELGTRTPTPPQLIDLLLGERSMCILFYLLFLSSINTKYNMISIQVAIY